MMPNTEWIKNFECHFDPSIKNYDKNYETDFFDFLTAKTEAIGLKKVAEISRPCFVFYFDPYYVKELNVPDLFLIKITGHALELSLDGDAVKNSFQISDTEEWGDLLSMIRMSVDLWVDYQCELVFQNAKSELKKIINTRASSEKLITEIKDLGKNLLSTITIEDIREKFNQSDVAQKLNLQINKLSDVILTVSDKVFLPFYCEKHHVWVLEVSDMLTDGVSNIFWLLYDIFYRFHSQAESQNLRSKWEEIFSLIDTPLVMMDESQHLEVYNREFVALNLSQKKCLELVDNEQIQINSESFQIKKTIITVDDQFHTLINFIPVGEELVMSNTSAEELGIVTSSLAHELNNPLAGVLAALTVLSMDELSEEMATRIDEMKSGVDRCKELVETFLGFSRVRSSTPLNQIKPINIQRTLDQALDLMRFRMIENNLKFSVTYQQEMNFLAPFNSSIMSMLFYLIFGEIVTSFSHYVLVAESQQDVIKLTVKEQTKTLSIEWDNKFSLSGNFVKSKLIQHLIESQFAKMKVSDKIELEFQ